MRLGLGGWRFFLAFLVAISHLYKDMIHGPAAYAVWGFFVLSGYLMTFVLTTKYGFDRKGLKSYAFNRFLRIYPGYIVVLVLGVITLTALRAAQVDPARLNPQFNMPQTAGQWLSNIAMVPFVSLPALPVPVAGALFVEVWVYALMPLFARSRHAAILALLVALAANQQFGFGVQTFAVRYSGFGTCLVAFAAGSVVCHYRAALARYAAPVLSVVIWCLHGLYWLHDSSWPWNCGILVSVPLSAWVVVSLAEIRTGTFDRWLGDLSYPMYLLHTTVGAWFLSGYGYDRPLSFFAVSFAVTLLLSWLMVVLMDRPLHGKKVNPVKAPDDEKLAQPLHT
ncbi:acyltransferase family protein [Azohydromonas caseinilytica]|uniref:Acyltransferase n=1 Tax=Azohydromonas caseinilytica TaxID=2728836 RepID=A0A848F653_9BURK|nr:acyltransferase [Azohydromonas caseinilytica]NML14165.1 acyltransferase [Azohydromonas caseinilytica]